MRIAMYMAVALVILSVITEIECSSNKSARSSAHTEPIRRRGNISQRGRRKNIWSYNPGHRSLAFLIAGEVEVVSPPPVESVTGVEYRCLGCCRERSAGYKSPAIPDPSNRVGRLVLRPDGLAVIGTEPNSVNDKCLGCCEDGVTPTNGVTTVTMVTRRGDITMATRRVMKPPVTGRQRAWQSQRRPANQKPCNPPGCHPNRRIQSSSSSEEISMVRRPPPRSRMQPIRSRMDSRCRHLGCRSPLGSNGDDSSSSSSEED
ncbi:uncharacterized protein ACMZJ9_009108 isoform 1-T3 [Mantella aurantiaca]